MIGIDPKTGKTVTGASALNCRFAKVLTTEVSSRIKRRGVGNRAVSRLGKQQTPTESMIVQNLTLEALSNPLNGLTDYQGIQCQAIPHLNGFRVKVSGTWRGEPLQLSGAL
ncbi:phage baseplate protein [Vibrio splendidus]|uniref:phage baseplate protein n=1 Tax=Vibrio splendidus TaxID=29497 RepID=UPI000D3AA6C0|nr:phage baseplate protein [Vibrio splendidus]PTO77562.1 phage baseplate protein [Vibrio splendidus]UOE84308.1 phage baseplate protein [Vibrio splendidus]UOE90237.1 phage baseplate protein [Vibrio splendidus]